MEPEVTVVRPLVHTEKSLTSVHDIGRTCICDGPPPRPGWSWHRKPVDCSAVSTYRGILRELKNRGVIRTTNAPTGDYAEFLVARLLGVELAPNSEKSWDVRSRDRKTLQIKSRVITNPRAVSERQLSPFRSFAFDEVAIVLFDDDYRLWRAVRIPVALAQERSTFRSHVNGHIVFAKDQLLNDPQAIDITDELRKVAGEL